MQNRKTLCLVIMLTAAAACNGDGLATDPTLADDGGGPSASRLAASVSCPNYPGMVEISAACMFDSNGKAYAEDGTLYVFPAAPPYGAKFMFKAGFTPRASDVTAQGADASIGVYAGLRYRSQLSGGWWAQQRPRSVWAGPRCWPLRAVVEGIFLDRAWDWRREEVAIGDVDSERSLKDEAFQPPRAVA